MTPVFVYSQTLDVRARLLCRVRLRPLVRLLGGVHYDPGPRAVLSDLQRSGHALVVLPETPAFHVPHLLHHLHRQRLAAAPARRGGPIGAFRSG